MSKDGFKQGSGCFQCQVCGKRTRDVDGENGPCQLCPRCYYLAGLENEHNDGYHREKAHPDCPQCALLALFRR